MTIEKKLVLFWGLFKKSRPMQVYESFNRHFYERGNKYSSSLLVLDKDTVVWLTDHPDGGRSYSGPEIDKHAEYVDCFWPSVMDNVLGRTTTIAWKPDDGEQEVEVYSCPEST